MFKKIVLVLAAFGLACVGYVAYQWQDTTPPSARKKVESLDPALLRPASSQPTTQMAQVSSDIKLPAGEAPVVRIIDPKTGETTMMFQALRWHPISETTFHLEQPNARVLLPGGQLAYIRADEGEITVQRDEKNNYNPKRGNLTGHVQLFIDRSTPKWRKENPNLAEPEQHPEAITKMWMDDVTFDLDLARLQTDGPIIVQSADGTVEGRGLTLVWNEVNRRIKLLKINQGKQATIHAKSLVQLGIAKAEPQGLADASPAVAPAKVKSPDAAKPPKSAKPKKKAVASAPAPEPGRVSTISLTELDDQQDTLAPDRVDTYQIVFKDNIVAEQRQGIRVVGNLKADMLGMLRDFGSHQRAAVEHAQSKPEDEDEHQDQADEAAPGDESASPAGGLAKKNSTLQLQWSGELVVVPLAQGATQPAGAAERFHVVATGNPVLVHDRESGDVSCRKLEYREETQEVWLSGTPTEFVTLQADPRRQIAGERILLNRKEGLARVDGPGRLIDRRPPKAEEDWPECIKTELKKDARRPATSAPGRPKDDAEQEVLVTWKNGVEVHFGIVKVEQPDPAGGPATTKAREYLKTAQFRGEVSFSQPGQTMAADLIDIVFSEPNPAKSQALASTGKATTDIVAEPDRSGVAAQTVRAEGHVRMLNDQSVIHCDRLDVDMTTNDVGDNVPHTGQAYGHVIARQGSQEIQSADGMTVTLASIPKQVNPIERERFEAAAKACGYTTESPEWKKVESKLGSRRTTVLRTLIARRDVAVKDPDKNVDVGAATLDCTFDDRQQISRALVMGTPQSPAHVSMTDFYIRGPQIDFDVTTQSAAVPGEGILRFYTKQDLTGQQVKEPVPVVVSWKNSMSFNGRDNVGLFSGSVRAVSQNTVLDGRELHLRFGNLPKEEATSQPAAGNDPRWIAGRVIDLLKDRNDQPKDEASAAGLSRDFRKRLVHLQVVGDGVISSSEYEKPKPQCGPFSSLMTSIMPDVLKTPASQPAKEDQRLLSFARVSGPRIAIDLLNEHMVVEGEGNLLILDYRLPTEGKEPKAATDNLATGLASSMQSGGPSQTVFTWQNSMSYLNRRNVAVLDNNVVMKHASGSQMAMPEQVAAAMKFDPRKLARGRRDELTCGNLVVEFVRNRARSEAEGSSLSSATELRALQASQRVRMQENNRAVEGDLITYDNSTGLVKIQGTPQMPAYGAVLNEKTGGLDASMRGQFLEWNLKTGVITSDASGTIIGN